MKALRHQQRGFTLIELMIVVVIVAILAAIAYPSYRSQVLKSRRADAVSALTTAAAAQERWYTERSQYTATLSDVAPATSENGYYRLGVVRPTPDTFTLTATAIGPQAADTNCAQFHITQTGAKTSENSGGAVTTDCW